MIACPLCGGFGSLPVTPHRRGSAWKSEQIAVAQRLRAAGLSAKSVARLFGPGNDPRAPQDVAARRRRKREQVMA
jgi:hypothetical protein